MEYSTQLKVTISDDFRFLFLNTPISNKTLQGAKNIDKLLYDPVNIFSENEDIIMKIYLTVNYAPAIGDEGTLDLFFELPFGGCQDDSTDDCSEVG